MRTKFYHIIDQLNHRYAAEVEDIITSPPQQDPYTNRLPPSRQQRAHQLLTLQAMGYRKSSQFMRHLRSLAPDVPDYLLRTLWTNRLPDNIQATLACHPEVELAAAADYADRITEAVSRPALGSISQPTDNAQLVKHNEQLSRM
jgi:hypothetical protein